MSKSQFWEENLPVGYYDKILESGINANKGIQSNWHNTTFNKIKNYVYDDLTHLDYACGPGTFIGKYTNSNSVGVDLSDDQISYANKKYSQKGEFIQYKNFNTKRYKNHFDVITVIGLLEFLDNDANLKVLDDLDYMLKPGGVLLMTTPNFRSSMTLLVLILNKFSKVSYKQQHINRFSKKSAYELLNQSKFKKDKIEVFKFINFGIFFSFFSWNIGSFINELFAKSFSDFFGYLLLVKVEKKNL